MTHNLSKASLV